MKRIFALLAVSALPALVWGCGSGVEDKEAEAYATLFSEFYNGCDDRGLYKVEVEGTEPGPDGWKQVAIEYVYSNGEVPDTGRALMLVSPDGKSIKSCVLDTDADICLCGKKPDWPAP